MRCHSCCFSTGIHRQHKKRKLEEVHAGRHDKYQPYTTHKNADTQPVLTLWLPYQAMLTALRCLDEQATRSTSWRMSKMLKRLCNAFNHQHCHHIQAAQEAQAGGDAIHQGRQKAAGRLQLRGRPHQPGPHLLRCALFSSIIPARLAVCARHMNVIEPARLGQNAKLAPSICCLSTSRVPVLLSLPFALLSSSFACPAFLLYPLLFLLFHIVLALFSFCVQLLQLGTVCFLDVVWTAFQHGASAGCMQRVLPCRHRL